ncbi:MAG: hypothetical protein ACPGVO_10800 [Spirulinaceae cyanobacterium]
MPDIATVQVSMPIAWLSQLQQLAQQRDRATSDLLQEAIAQYLGVPLPQREERLHQLEAEMVAIKRQLAGLNRQLSQGQQPTTVRAEILEVSGDRPAAPENWVDNGPNDEPDHYETDDEPDEILYDFLPPEER